MKIWAHRGCSQQYPENTITAFEKAAELKNLTGIELDIQLTKDGQIVVCHDERVDRTTDGTGYICEHTLAELKNLRIKAGVGCDQAIPAMGEVLDLLETRLKAGLKLNIELKNSIIPYEGMEEKIVDLVHRRGVEEAVIYSSFYGKSLEKIRKLDQKAELGILDVKVSDCMYKQKGGCGAVALHPFWQAMDLPAKQLLGYTVRAWMSGHLYPEVSTGRRLDIRALEEQGITDLILNEPEVYTEYM